MDGAGMSAAEADEWASAGWDTEAVWPWWRAGFSCAAATRWKRAGVHDPAEAAAWVAAGVTDAQEAAERVATGRRTPEAVTRIRARRLYADAEWGEEWRRAGFTAHAAEEWIVAGVLDADDARAFLEAGFPPREASEWDRRFIEADEAERWKAAGFTPQEAARWEEECMEPIDARYFIDHGIGPEVALASDLPTKQRWSPFRGGACAQNQHEQCRELRSCACACHCWHDGRQWDRHQQVAWVGTNVPRFVLGDARSEACGRNDHGRCFTGKRCRCQCHCYHRAS